MAASDQVITDRAAIYNGDCLAVMPTLPDESVHFSIYSPPFAGLYNYSSDERDVSNCDDHEQFYDHYAFVVRETFRLTMPGRLTAVHCMNLLSGNSGGDHLIDLPGGIIRLHEDAGWKFVARHTIWKEPLWIRNRTMAKDLAHITVVKDAARAGVAQGDYLIMFRKPGVNPVPIAHPTGLDYYAGECPIPPDLYTYRNWTGDQKENRFSHWIWRRYASCIWDDIRMGRVLPYQDCKEPDDEKHVHALQLDVIDRAIVLRTNPGEVVLTPFMGVGSEVYSAVRLGRKAIGIELKPSYFRQAVKNVNAAALESPEVEAADLVDMAEAMD